jgi:hypothetical protein
MQLPRFEVLYVILGDQMEVLSQVHLQPQDPQGVTDELYELSLEEICEVFGGGGNPIETTTVGR